MIETGLAAAGLFSMPEIFSKTKTEETNRSADCRSCEHLLDGKCKLGFEKCSFEKVPVRKRGKTVQKVKCPDYCTYAIDGYCMGVCMKNTLEEHRKRWKSKKHDGGNE